MTKEEYISNLISVKEMNVDYIPLQVCLGIIADALIFLLNDKAESKIKMNDILTKIQEEIEEYGSIWVEYRNDDTIENIVSSVINQVKEQVIDIINKYKEETDND